jgi:hypothetical protein
MSDWYDQSGRYGALCARISQADQQQQHTWRMHVEGSTPFGRRRRTSARSGRSQLLWTLLGQTVSTASFLLITGFNHNKVYDHTRIASYWRWNSKSVGQLRTGS